MKQLVTLDLEIMFVISTGTDPVPTIDKDLGEKKSFK
jgi:hypothetical protein